MRRLNRTCRAKQWVAAGVFLSVALTACQAMGAGYGRVSGTVTDTSGKPIMGATVLLTGGGIDALGGPLESTLSRAFTDAQGKFTIRRVAPGWYSLQVISPARLPGFRNRIEVRAGSTTREAFALGNILSGIQFEPPSRSGHAWSHEWKWILRTSASTRPVLRYREAGNSRKEAARRAPLPSRRLVAMMPESGSANGLSEDPGTSTMVAYLRPLDEDSDLLVAGSNSSNNIAGQSVIAEYRSGLLHRNYQDISLAVHQMTLDGNDVALSSANGKGMPTARGMVLRYMQTRQLTRALTVTAGFEMKYLNSTSDASTAQPVVDLAYQLDRNTILHLSYGSADRSGANTLTQRVSDLNAFPRITLQNFHPRLEDSRHAELRLQRSLTPNSSIEVAAYHDAFSNVAVWGVGHVHDLGNFSKSGNVLVIPMAGRAVLNGGDYGSSGAEVAYQRRLGRLGEMGVMYAFGSALGVSPSATSGFNSEVDASNIAAFLRSEFTQSVSYRFSTSVPVLRTQIINTYSWLPAGRVTLVDPYGQDRLEFAPFWGLQVRQPLPRIDMLPLRIVAIADFRNLLGQGSVGLRRADGTSVLLTPAYRTIRGGFSVQF